MCCMMDCVYTSVMQEKGGRRKGGREGGRREGGGKEGRREEGERERGREGEKDSLGLSVKDSVHNWNVHTLTKVHV